MNQDVTAPGTARGRKPRNSLTDATADWALYEHARLALHNFRLSELAALSNGCYSSAHADIPPLRNMKAAVSAAVSEFNATFADCTAATRLGDVSSMMIARTALYRLENGGQLYSEATTNTIDRSDLSIGEPATTLERFVRALGEWKGLLAPDHFDAMVQHVDRLLSDQDELDEDNIVPSPSSFDDFSRTQQHFPEA